MRRFIIEFGLGTDFHGQDVNKAAQKAVRDAMSRCCLCGLSEVLGISDFNKVVSSIFRKKVCGVWQEQSQPATEVSSGATSR